MPDKRAIHPFVLVLVTVLGALTAGCGAQPAASLGREITMAPLSAMPAEVQSAPVAVQQAYQFAAANPEVMQHIPCYCGCGAMGHTSNYSCYVSGPDAGGMDRFDTHALGCSICVDITHDVIRLSREGQTVIQIRAYVDATYAKYGPSNMAPAGQ